MDLNDKTSIQAEYQVKKLLKYQSSTTTEPIASGGSGNQTVLHFLKINMKDLCPNSPTFRNEEEKLGYYNHSKFGADLEPYVKDTHFCWGSILQLLYRMLICSASTK